MLLLVNAPLRYVDLVDGLRSWVIDFRGDCRLADALPLFVDEANQEAALLVRH